MTLLHYGGKEKRLRKCVSFSPESSPKVIVFRKTRLHLLPFIHLIL